MKYNVNPNPLRAGLFLAAACVAGACAASAAETKAAAQTKAAGETKINTQQLAVTERALEFCSSVDPDSAKKLKEKVAELTKGASADAVAQARSSDGYKAAYSTMDSFIGEIDPRNAKVACTNTAGNNTAGKK
ncbi:MAG TPA: hypothetical protein VII35_16600 [Steroidobacteraceae bacterium]